MHALGFEHEQTRYDRDMYMKVLWQNIETANAYNFNKQPRTLSFPKFDLDFRSVMMYRLTAFSLNPSTLPAMTVVVSKFIPGFSQHTFLTTDFNFDRKTQKTFLKMR
jgi:Astacin (Peptidase family M12A)